MRRAKKEPKLDEVKFVLKKLQRLDLSIGESADATSPRGAPLVRLDPGKLGRKSTAGRNPAQPRRRMILYLSVASAMIFSIIILFAAGIASVPYDLKLLAGKGGPSGLIQEDQSDSTVLTEARQALSEGDVLRARSTLERGQPGRHAKVAFMLAQSYDPNYLQSLTKANGLPDKAEARRWYEKWYELAVLSGLKMDSEHLQRIINAVR